MNIASRLVAHQKTYQRLCSLFRENKLPNTLLFSGLKSVGKYKTSLALTQSILCESDEACGVCGSCIRVDKEQHESVFIVKPEKGLIKVEQAREVIQFLSQKLNQEEYKIVVVDGAECFNNQSANALLKTLEEPPENCFIILVTHSLHALLATIRSRSQVFRFGSLTKEDILKIKPVDNWLIDFSENNLQKIDELSEEVNQQIYMDLAESVASLSASTFSVSIKKIESVIKSKDQCLILIQALQRLFKKECLRKLNLETMVLDWQEPAFDKLKPLDEGRLFILFNDSIKMEYELSSNFDILLSFESIYKKILTFLKEVENAPVDRYSHAP